jgi:hypothetical protein
VKQRRFSFPSSNQTCQASHGNPPEHTSRVSSGGVCLTQSDSAQYLGTLTCCCCPPNVMMQRVAHCDDALQIGAQHALRSKVDNLQPKHQQQPPVFSFLTEGKAIHCKIASLRLSCLYKGSSDVLSNDALPTTEVSSTILHTHVWQVESGDAFDEEPI